MNKNQNRGITKPIETNTSKKLHALDLNNPSYTEKFWVFSTGVKPVIPSSYKSLVIASLQQVFESVFELSEHLTNTVYKKPYMWV